MVSSSGFIDSTGALSNTDNDDIDPVGSEYYYDDKGNRITTEEEIIQVSGINRSCIKQSGAICMDNT